MLWLLLATAQAHDFVVHPVLEGEGWCRIVNEVAEPGDVITLPAGTFEGGCVITNEGVVDENEALTIFGAFPEETLIRGGDPVITVRGSSVRIVGVALEGQGGGTGARVTGDRVVLERVRVRGVQTGVLTTGPMASHAILFGDFDGVSAPIRIDGPVLRPVVRGSLIRGHDQIAISLSSAELATVSDNVLGPGAPVGIEVRGPAEVRSNLIFGPGDGLRIVGGPSLVRTNLITGTTGVGIDVQAAVTLEVLDNTVVPAAGEALRLDALRLEVAGNALLADDVPEGNVACDDSCWVDVEAHDLRPAPQGPLVDVAAPRLASDFCEAPRGDPADAGAIEAGAPFPGGRLDVLSKVDVLCVTDLPEEGCGCGGDGPASALILLLVSARRRRDGCTPRRT